MIRQSHRGPQKSFNLMGSLREDLLEEVMPELSLEDER